MIDADAAAVVASVSDEEAVLAALRDGRVVEERAYEGMAYSAAGDAWFAIVDGFMVFCVGSDIVPKFLDVARGAAPSIAASLVGADRTRAALASDADIAVYLDVDRAEPVLLRLLADLPDKMPTVEFDEDETASIESLVTDLDRLGVTISIGERGITWTGESRHKTTSVQRNIPAPQMPLQVLASLPGDSFVAVSQGVANGGADRAAVKAETAAKIGAPFAEIFDVAPDGYFGVLTAAMRMSDHVLPEVILTMPLNGAPEAEVEAALREGFEALAAASIRQLDGKAELSEPTEAASVEYSLGSIKGWTMTVSSQPLEDSGAPVNVLLPPRVGVWYTFVDGTAHAVFAPTVDAATDLVQSFRQPDVTIGDRLPPGMLDALPAEATAAFVLSPNMLFKSVIRLLGPEVPPLQALGAFVQFLPDDYGIAAATTHRSDGASATGVVDAAVLAPLVQFAVMAAGSM